MPLTPSAYSRAREFLLTRARPLERALFRFHFENAPAAEARCALAAYQNQDGGFGRALEPDCRLPDSSALATCVAFEHMRALCVPAGDPMVHAAVRWTQAAFDRALRRWLLVPAAVNQWPHAPWWTWQGPGEPGCTANPGVEFVAHLWRYREVTDPEFLSEITELAEHVIETLPVRPEMHDLLCVIRLAETPAVPAALRNRAAERVRRAGPAIVARSPAEWTGYGVKPLLLAPAADSLLAPVLREAVDANLEFEIARQGADGAWAPNWNWLGQYPSDWPQAEAEWKGVLTLHTLLTLHSYHPHLSVAA